MRIITQPGLEPAPSALEAVAASALAAVEPLALVAVAASALAVEAT